MIRGRSPKFTSVAVITAWLILFAASTTVLVGEILRLGFFPRTESFRGPFDQETSGGGRSFVFTLGRHSRLGSAIGTSGDTPNDPYRSTLELRINGQSAGPPHSIHEEIRKAGDGRYSHWGDVVIFSLPEGIENGPNTIAVVEYAPELQPYIYGFSWLVLVSSAGFLAFRSWRLDPETFRRRREFSAPLAATLCRALFGAAIIGVAVYVVTIGIGLLQHNALPNTAVFRLLPWTRELAMYEPAAHYVIAVIAMLGALLSWLAPAAFQKYEAQLIRYWNRYALLAIVALFLFSLGATWNGIARPEDLQSNAMGGLVPLSDAQRHYQMAFHQVITGHWAPFAEQRPFAAAQRTLMMFPTGYSNVAFLVLQAFTIGCVTYAAARAVMLWRGVWSGLMFFALTLGIVRPFLNTYLTEPLGQFWTLMSVPFVIRLLRRGTLVDGAVGFLATTMSLLTRMGSMFTIPAFAIWLAWTESRDRKRLKHTISIIAAVLVGCSLVSATLLRLYGSRVGFLGSNFSFVICGATHGGDWTTCRSLYHEELGKVGPIFTATQAQFLYAKAWERFRRDPSTLFHRLIEGEQIFLKNLIPVMLGGYLTPILPRWFPRTGWTLVAACGLIVTLWRRSERRERSFWLFMWLGLLASAPLVIFADGWRILSSILPFFAVFFACGFATPGGIRVSTNTTATRNSTLALAGLIVTMSLWIVTPGMAHWLNPVGTRVLETSSPDAGERIVLSGRHMAGFVVVPDDRPIPTNVPSMRRSDFSKALEYSGHEALQKLSLPAPSTPFAFIVAPNPYGTYGTLFVTPADVLIRREVPAWRLKMEKEIWEEEDAYVGRASAATPIETPNRPNVYK